MLRSKTELTQRSFLFLCWILYFTSYVTRLNYGAALVDIIADTGMAKSAAGLVSTASFVTYCIGQFLCGVISDRVSARRMIFCGLFFSALTNIALPLWPNASAMLVFWGINGFAQAMIWPALIRIMAEFFEGNFFGKACVSISVASSAGTIFVYLLVPLCIAFGGWQSVFFISSGFGIAISLIWLFGSRGAEAEGPAHTPVPEAEAGSSAPQPGVRGLFALAPLASMSFAVVLHGILKDGLVTWSPTLLSEVYGIDASMSVLTTVALPLFSIFSVYITARIDRRWFHNEVKTSLVLFTVSCAAALFLFLFLGTNAAVSILCMAVLVACMYGINMMLISYTPKRFDAYGRVAFVSGFLNACTYLGSAASSYGLAAAAEAAGWKWTVLILFLITLAASLICLFRVRKWTKFIQ